jgi:hypothetical protein
LIGWIVLGLGLALAWAAAYVLLHDGGAASACLKAGGSAGHFIAFPIAVSCDLPGSADLVGVGNWVITGIAYGTVAVGGWTIVRAELLRRRVEKQFASVSPEP